MLRFFSDVKTVMLCAYLSALTVTASPVQCPSSPLPLWRYLRDNVILSEGLSAVIGLNFAELPVQRQLDMMREMTVTRYRKVS